MHPWRSSSRDLLDPLRDPTPWTEIVRRVIGLGPLLVLYYFWCAHAVAELGGAVLALLRAHLG